MEVVYLKKLSITAISLAFILAIGINSISCIVNTPPTLEGGSLLYTLNNNTSSYRAIVMYKDIDGDLPRYMFVYLNGSKRIMEKLDIKDNNAKDGIVYTLPINSEEFSQLTHGTNEWSIKYSFRTNDGYGVVSTEESNTMLLDYEQMGLTMEYSSGSGGKCGR